MSLYSLAYLRYRQQIVQQQQQKQTELRESPYRLKVGVDPITGDRLYESADGGSARVPYEPLNPGRAKDD